MQDLLQDEAIYKVGVAPADDAKYLALDYDIHLKGTLDVRHIAISCGLDAGGLAAMSKSLLGIILDKSWRVISFLFLLELHSVSPTQYSFPHFY